MGRGVSQRTVIRPSISISGEGSVGLTPNQNPTYDGSTTINDLTVGVARQLEGSDPEGDEVTWSMDASPYASITASGLLIPLQAGSTTIRVYLDDGQP